MMKILASALLFLICASYLKAEPIAPSLKSARTVNHQGRDYLQKLADMIQQADKIVVTEHSDEYDAFNVKTGKSLIKDEIVYGSIELNKRQRNSFLSTIKGLDPKTQNAFPACIIESHHTIRFYAATELLSTMRICFHCGQVEWDAAKNITPPWSIYEGLAALIKDVGLSPKRDWEALAKQYLQ